MLPVSCSPCPSTALDDTGPAATEPEMFRESDVEYSSRASEANDGERRREVGNVLDKKFRKRGCE